MRWPCPVYRSSREVPYGRCLAGQRGVPRRLVGQPRLGQVVERDVQRPAEPYDGAEGRRRQPAHLDLAQGFGGDSRRQSHVAEAPVAAGGPQGDAESPSRSDLFGGERLADHA